MNKKSIFIALLCVLFLGCKNNENKIIEGKVIYQDVSLISDDVMSFVEQYIQRHPNYNAFLITNIQLCDKDMPYFKDFYIIGPAYEYLFKENKYPALYFVCKEKKVFLKLGVEDLLTKDKNNDTLYLKNQIATNDTETEYSVTPYTMAFYLTEGILFSIDSKGKPIIISEKTDTIFLPPNPIEIE